jgi:hypothetical protein
MLCIRYISNFLFISVFIIENLFLFLLLYYSYKDLILNYCRRNLLRIAELRRGRKELSYAYEIYDLKRILN